MIITILMLIMMVTMITKVVQSGCVIDDAYDGNVDSVGDGSLYLV